MFCLFLPQCVVGEDLDARCNELLVRKLSVRFTGRVEDAGPDVRYMNLVGG